MSSLMNVDAAVEQKTYKKAYAVPKVRYLPAQQIQEGISNDTYLLNHVH